MSHFFTRNKRMLTIAGIQSALFSLATVLGTQMKSHGTLADFGFGQIALFVLLTAVYAAALYGLFSLMDRANREKEPKQESMLSKITGSWFVVFVLLLICWVPVWLAFWPGLFTSDTLTQFYSCYNEELSSHYPLVHTVFLGWVMMLGIDLHPEGAATWGVAIYCGIQLALTAGCVAYACAWMRRRRIPLCARLIVTLLFMLSPFYAPWGFYPEKDVVFGVLVLVFGLQLADLWTFGLKPLRVLSFVLIALLMMFLRNNGVYALALLVPFAVLWAKGKRVKIGALLCGCIALFLALNSLLISVLYAEKGSKVEILSTPLQQIARTLRDHPEAIELDEDGVLETLYGGINPADLYTEWCSDPVKWDVDYDLLDEYIPDLLHLWARMCVKYFPTFADAFVVQNLPYILPGCDMASNFDLFVVQGEWFPIEKNSYLPGLQRIYENYDDNRVFMGVEATRVLSDPAVFVWLAMAGLSYALLRKRYGLASAFGYLVAVWFTSLLGPIAVMRYVLCLYYAVPILWAALFMPKKN